MVRTIEVAGVDVIDTASHRFAKYCDCGLGVLRRAEHARACELHRSISDSVDPAISQNKGTHSANLLFSTSNVGAIPLHDNGSQSVQVVRNLVFCWFFWVFCVFLLWSFVLVVFALL